MSDRAKHGGMEPLERDDFFAGELMSAHPPIWRHPNKQVVFDIACPPGATHGGRPAYSRWSAMRPPAAFEPARALELVSPRPGFFDYLPALDAPTGIDWHVNFADPHLFVAYGSSLFAQDEIQVAEHPALGALGEALVSSGRRALTVDGGVPTPILVMGAERRCHVATAPNAAAGNPGGLYGNAFARATPEMVARSTTRIDPPTITNLIAMSAPAGGRGRYSVDELEWVLASAFTGFRAAVLESRREGGDAAAVAIHTGYWGCGAFGGNRVVMALLQVIAAEMAGIDQLVFHVGATSGRGPLDEALEILRMDLPPGSAKTHMFIDRIASMGFEWGVSDGN